MVLTRSLSRQAAASTSDISAGAKGARYEDSVGGVAASPAHIYIEQSWRQRTVRLTRHAAAADSSASAVSRQRLDTADRHLTLTCRHHSPRSREYIVRSDAPLLGIVDYAVAAVTAMVLALIAFAWPEQLTRLQTALALLPLALSAAFKLRAVRQESVLCVSRLGVQLTTTFVSGRTSRRFFDLAAIDTVILHEGISLYRIVDYLALVLKDKRRMGAGGGEALQSSAAKESGKRLVIVFEQLRPRLCVIRCVWRGMRCVLYDEPE